MQLYDTNKMQQYNEPGRRLARSLNVFETFITSVENLASVDERDLYVNKHLQHVAYQIRRQMVDVDWLINK